MYNRGEGVKQDDNTAIKWYQKAAEQGLTASQKNLKLMYEKWKVDGLLRVYGGMRLSTNGEITFPESDVTLDFLFAGPHSPIIKPAISEYQFNFDSTPPTGGQGVKIIFSTSKVKGANAAIPRFTPVLRYHDKEGTLFDVSKFAEYGGKYNFSIKLVRGSGYSLSIVETNWFKEGAEHYIYGDVQLFGARFSNKSNAPFIFKISGNKYVWVSGNGSVATKKGDIVNIISHED